MATRITHKRLRAEIRKLDEYEQIALHLRMWENLLIYDIAAILNLSWDETDKLIENALVQLRRNLLNNKNKTKK